jgi:uncharacterized membrane protein
MTVSKSDKISIPTWILVLVLPLVISLVTTLTVYSFSSGKQANQVEINTKEIDQKADKDMMNMLEKEIVNVQSTLVRIENKLDSHIKDNR